MKKRTILSTCLLALAMCTTMTSHASVSKSSEMRSVTIPTIAPGNIPAVETGTVVIYGISGLGSAIDVSLTTARTMIKNSPNTYFQSFYILAANTPSVVSYRIVASRVMSSSMSDFGLNLEGYVYYGTYFMMGCNAFKNDLAVHNMSDSLNLLPLYRISYDTDIPLQSVSGHTLSAANQYSFAANIFQEHEKNFEAVASAIDLSFQDAKALMKTYPNTRFVKMWVRGDTATVNGTPGTIGYYVEAVSAKNISFNTAPIGPPTKGWSYLGVFLMPNQQTLNDILSNIGTYQLYRIVRVVNIRQ